MSPTYGECPDYIHSLLYCLCQWFGPLPVGCWFICSLAQAFHLLQRRCSDQMLSDVVWWNDELYGSTLFSYQTSYG